MRRCLGEPRTDKQDGIKADRIGNLSVNQIT